MRCISSITIAGSEPLPGEGYRWVCMLCGKVPQGRLKSYRETILGSGGPGIVSG
jgi:hypothetical protein